MKEKLVRPLTGEEMKTTFGGETWVGKVWRWLKKHVFVETSNDPNDRIRGGIR